MSRLPAVVFALAAAAPACTPGTAGYYAFAPAGAEVEYTKLNASPRLMKPRIPERVEMFSCAVTSRPFVEVGVFEIRNAQYLAGESEELQGRLRIEGAYRGCDGLLLTIAAEGAVAITGRAHRTYRASCIVYRAPAPTAAPVLRADDEVVADPKEVTDVDDRQLQSVGR